MSQDEPPLSDAEIAAFMRRLVRQIMQEETQPRRPKPSPVAAALHPKHVAARWGCSDRTVRNMVRDGLLPGVRVGKKLLRVRLEDVERYELEMKQNKPEAPVSDPPKPPSRDPLARLRLAELRKRGRHGA